MINRFWEHIAPSRLAEMSNEQIEHEIQACDFDLNFAQLSKEERNSIKEEMEFWKNVKKEREVK